MKNALAAIFTHRVTFLTGASTKIKCGYSSPVVKLFLDSRSIPAVIALTVNFILDAGFSI